MHTAADQPLIIDGKPAGRFARFAAIKWWNQSLLREAKILVIGAGALGNEIVKNLALLGVGNIVIADMDRIEESNLSRSVLFRATDEGLPKADAAARAAREIYADSRITPVQANILADLGLGYFRWADIVVGALDNREARLFVNRACAQVGRPWIDGGIDILNGIVRGFAPPQTACYECTLGEADWDLLNKRRSCSLLARKAFAEGGTPTTPTTASVIGAMQVQEVVKSLHGLDSLRGRAFVFEGLNHNSFIVGYPISPDCPWHEPPAQIQSVDEFGKDAPLFEVWSHCQSVLGGLDSIDLSREIVEALECPNCSRSRQIFRPVDSITDDQARCDACGHECVPHFIHSLAPGSPLLNHTAAQLGLPRWDVVWGRFGDRAIGIEFSADRYEALGPPAVQPNESTSPRSASHV
jgi:adenylyltransferase/sulfurtransferase